MKSFPAQAERAASISTLSQTGTINSTDGGVSDTVTDSEISAISKSSSAVVLQASNAITVDPGVQISLGTANAPIDFTLEAGNSITLNSNATITGAGISGSIVLEIVSGLPAPPSSAATGAAPGTQPAIQLNGGTLTFPNGSIYLLAGTGGAVDIGGASLVQAANRTVSIVADSLNVTGGPTITGSIIRIAPATPNTTVSLGTGATGTGLVIDGTAFAALNANNTLSIGVPSFPTTTTASQTTAGSIDVAGAVTVAGTASLQLTSAGDITGAFPIMMSPSPATVLIVSPNGKVDLSSSSNAVTNVSIGPGANISSFNLIDSVPLSVGLSGVTASTTANITAPAITVNQPVTAPQVTLTANNGALDIIGTVTGTTAVTLEGNGIFLNGFVNAGTGTLTLTSTGAITQNGGNELNGVGGITAGTLTGSAAGVALLNVGTTDSTGTVVSFNNRIPNLDGFSSDGIHFNTRGALTISGPVSSTGTLHLVSGGAMTVNAPLQSALSSYLSGYSIALNSTVTGSSVTLAALNYKTGLDNNITLNSGASITASGIVRLAAGDAAKYAIANPPNLQTGPSTIALNGATVTSTGGNVFLLAGTGGSVDIAGPGGVQAPNGTVSIVANSLTVTGSPTVTGNTLTIAPATQGATVSLGGGETGLVIGQSALAALGGVGTLSVGVAATPSPTSEAFTTAITAGSIDVAGAVNVGANTLALSSTGDITGAGQITAGLLTATSSSATGQVSLTNPANAVAALGAVSADALTFIDGVPLTLDGNITATDIQIGAAQLLTVANGVTITTGFDPLAQVPASQAPPDSNGSTGLNLAILNGAGTIVLGPNVTNHRGNRHREPVKPCASR